MELKHNISKFWPRIGALLIDFMIIGIFGLILGLIFEDFFVSMGRQGLIFGLIITLIYFSIGNSEISKGQTIGKKAVKIKTIDSSGSTISMQKSLLRACILFAPYFLINYPIPGVDDLSFLNVYKGSILISALAGIIILYIANKSTRQSLHDLVIGTYVVKDEDSENVSELQPNSKIGIYLSIGLTIALISFTTYNLLNKDSVINDYDDVIGKISKIDGILSVEATRNTTTFYGDEESITESYSLLLHVQDIPDGSDFEQSKIVKESVKILFQLNPEVKGLDLITVTLNRGFNIGIAKKNNSFSSSKSPTDWSEIIE
ncbi:RDD family protein [Marivirga harenae]|uniref:RDD family protein n=1 Tax=Marivirga harenae TaxID=2010992 RepID=UPI0026E0EC73|nr:RDD family protein [Marivirga harenae]WKV11814.1 RDD family protein [Marivirga harenae]